MNPEGMVWELQEWDTPKSFYYFRTYFLPQTMRPRTLTAAYRHYLLKEQGFTQEEVEKKKTSGMWQRYFYAWDRNDIKLEGSLTWAERAEAWDAFEAGLIDQIVDGMREKVIKDEFEDYKRQHRTWSSLLDALVMTIDFQQATKGPKFNPTGLIQPMEKLVKMRETIAVFGRRTANMPSTIHEDRIADNEGNAFKIEWAEPFSADEEVGLGAEIIQSVLNKRKSERLEKEETDE